MMQANGVRVSAMTHQQRYHLTRVSLYGELISSDILPDLGPALIELLAADSVSDVSLRLPTAGEVHTYRKAGL